jgi:hypothetical protein
MNITQSSCQAPRPGAWPRKLLLHGELWHPLVTLDLILTTNPTQHGPENLGCFDPIIGLLEDDFIPFDFIRPVDILMWPKLLLCPILGLLVERRLAYGFVCGEVGRVIGLSDY